MPKTFNRDDRVMDITDDSGEILIVVDSYFDFTFVRTFDGFSYRVQNENLRHAAVPAAMI